MKRLHFIPDRNNLEDSIRFIDENHAACEYNDFFLASILDDKKKQLEIIDVYAKVRSDFSKDTIHGAFLDVTVHSSDAKIREISELRVRQSMDIAKEMGVRGVVFHTNRLYGFRDAVYLKNWKEINKQFFLKICEEYPNQEIFMENMFDEAPDVLYGLAEEMKDVENFGICLDYAHATISDVSAKEWMKMSAPFIHHLHINDNDLKNDLHAALGDGQIDWRVFERELEEYKIDASILIEVTGLEKQRKSLEFLKTNGILLQ